MRSYKYLLSEVLENGITEENRTDVPARRIAGRSLDISLQDGFPLLTTKRIHVRSVIHELLWFLSGNTNVSYLHENGVTIWDEWANENGDLGPIYGAQWRNFGGVDQISWLMEEAKRNPNSRRLLVSAWNPPDLPKMALPPCHVMFQVVIQQEKLHLIVYQRSADIFLGVPFNIASYALLAELIAHQLSILPVRLVMNFGDLHLYENHVEQAEIQLSREPRSLPDLLICRRPSSIFEYCYEDFNLVGYDPHPAIKADVAV
ncbi:MAG: thymidylate synthase [Gammaproteobacteria bacterium]|nr:MAG: thymidylate synthase [Gammaproteobacteria bacterium]